MASSHVIRRLTDKKFKFHSEPARLFTKILFSCREYFNLFFGEIEVYILSKMSKRAAGFLIYRIISSDIEYLLMKASYGIKHWTPPKGLFTLIQLLVESCFDLIRSFAKIDFCSQVMWIQVKMILLQH